MTEKRFVYVRGKYKHGIQDVEKDGEHKKGYRTTYDDFDLDKLADELNIRENKIKTLKYENEQLKKLLECSREEANDYCEELMGKDEFIRLYKRQRDEVIEENEQLKQQLADVDRLIDDLGHDEMRRQYEEIFKGDVE